MRRVAATCCAVLLASLMPGCAEAPAWDGEAFVATFVDGDGDQQDWRLDGPHLIRDGFLEEREAYRLVVRAGEAAVTWWYDGEWRAVRRDQCVHFHGDCAEADAAFLDGREDPYVPVPFRWLAAAPAQHGDVTVVRTEQGGETWFRAGLGTWRFRAGEPIPYEIQHGERVQRRVMYQPEEALLPIAVWPIPATLPGAPTLFAGDDTDPMGVGHTPRFAYDALLQEPRARAAAEAGCLFAYHLEPLEPHDHPVSQAIETPEARHEFHVLNEDQVVAWTVRVVRDALGRDVGEVREGGTTSYRFDQPPACRSAPATAPFDDAWSLLTRLVGPAGGRFQYEGATDGRGAAYVLWAAPDAPGVTRAEVDGRTGALRAVSVRGMDMGLLDDPARWP